MRKGTRTDRARSEGRAVAGGTYFGTRAMSVYPVCTFHSTACVSESSVDSLYRWDKVAAACPRGCAFRSATEYDRLASRQRHLSKHEHATIKEDATDAEKKVFFNIRMRCFLHTFSLCTDDVCRVKMDCVSLCRVFCARV